MNNNSGAFSAVFHVSISEPDTVYSAFVDFVQHIKEEEHLQNRRGTENFLEDNSIKPKTVAKNSHQSNPQNSSGGVSAAKENKIDNENDTFKINRL